MDSHSLYVAILNGDDRTIDRLVRPLVDQLVVFLATKLGAQRDDARDVVQNTLMYVFQRIREGKIQDPERILHYILIACRHNYFRLQHEKRRNRPAVGIVRDVGFSEPQLEALMQKERIQILRSCVDTLHPKHREFILYLMECPDATTQQVAERFRISVSNAWVRKHRLTTVLSKCVTHRMNR